jgi:hypothetical protein
VEEVGCLARSGLYRKVFFIYYRTLPSNPSLSYFRLDGLLEMSKIRSPSLGPAYIDAKGILQGRDGRGDVLKLFALLDSYF